MQIQWWIIGILVSLVTFLLGFIIQIVKPSYLKMSEELKNLVIEVRGLVATINEREVSHKETHEVIDRRLNDHSRAIRKSATDIEVIKVKLK